MVMCGLSHPKSHDETVILAAAGTLHIWDGEVAELRT